MSIVKVNWSGGKDSTAALLLHLEAKDKVKAVCYVPYFTDNIPLITKEHYDFIISAKKTFEEMGAEVHIVSGITYKDFVLKRSTRGKYKGRMFGFPLFFAGKCGFNLYSKAHSLNTINIGEYDYEDIGIAYDEVKRYHNIHDNKISILIQKQMSEVDAYNYCKVHNLLSPVYASRFRDGCALCPQASQDVREKWLSDYPEAREILIELQEIVKKERSDISVKEP